MRRAGGFSGGRGMVIAMPGVAVLTSIRRPPTMLPLSAAIAASAARGGAILTSPQPLVARVAGSRARNAPTTIP